MPYPFKFPFTEANEKLEAIRLAAYTKVAPLKVRAWKTSEPVVFSKKQTGEKIELEIGQKWGNLFDCAWFRFSGKVPPHVRGKKVVCVLDISGEMLVVDDKGQPVCGLTTTSSVYDFTLGKPGKKYYTVFEKAKGNEQIDIWADAGCNDLFGNLQCNGVLTEAHIAICNEQMRLLAYDFEVLYDLSKQLSSDSTRYQRIIKALYDAMLVLCEYSESEAIAARKILAEQLAIKGSPLLTVSAVGHGHIDLAWLWPIRETIRKGARTFATALKMMDRYPEYVFGASQPQLYLWIKQYYPDLYRRIKQKIKQGRWEVQGCMWVEADMNIPCGESLVRQILYGKRFFRKEFQLDIDNLWLPDVFGFSGSLPQLMAKSGVKHFMTQKLSWNDTTDHPYHTFFWEGIDGSKVLSHLPPEDTYNSPASPASLAKIEREYIEKAISDNSLLVFGIGDGGGGPGEEHIERLLRERNLHGLPAVIQEPAYKLFKKLEKNASQFKTWIGELYLEKHRGCYTTQSRNKRWNSQMEIALHELEFLASLNLTLTKKKYPAAELEEIWQEVLLYQFHDILPGSSITRVYDESLARYKTLYKKVQLLIEYYRKSLAESVNCSSIKKPVLISNSLSWQRNEWIKTGHKWIKATVPPMGYAVIDSTQPAALSVCTASKKHIENDLLRIDFEQNGEIKAIYDKRNNCHTLDLNHRGNVFSVYDDTGNAWDFPREYRSRPAQQMKLESSQMHVDGHQAVMRQIWNYKESQLVQEILLKEGTRRIDFVTKVDWRQPRKMLRVSFRTAVTSAAVQCGIQFGSIARSSRKNTPADLAKFEICANRWVDISDNRYGVAIMSDCKYGYKVSENLLDINLLRTPTFPDPVADIANHEFTYSLYPHAGDHVDGGVMQASYELNYPLLISNISASSGPLPAEFSFVKLSKPEIVVETIKKSEDDNTVILRFFESSGKAIETEMSFSFTPKQVSLVNLMEEQIKALACKKNKLSLKFGPFEIHTIKLAF